MAVGIRLKLLGVTAEQMDQLTATIDPDGPGPFFETPTSLLPEDLAFIP